MLPLTTAYFISAGMIVISAGYCWFLARSSSLRKTCNYFIWLSTCFAGFQVCAALQYQSNSLEEALGYHKLVNSFQLLIFGASAQFLSQLFRKPKLNIFSSAVMGLVALALWLNQKSPYGYRFKEIDTQWATTILGEPIFILSGTLSIESFIVGPMAIFLALMIHKGIHQNDNSQASNFVPRTVLLWGLVYLVICVATTRLADVGVIRVPYLPGFGFVILSVVFAFQIKSDLSKLSRTRLRKLYLKQRSLLRPEVEAKRSIKKTLKQLKRSNTPFSIFLFEIDRYDQIAVIEKTISKIDLGQLIVEELSSFLFLDNTVRRYAPNKFIAILDEVSDQKLIAELCREIKSHFLNKPLKLNATHLRITLSFGVVLSTAQGLASQNPLEAAELALSEAKLLGLNSHRFYDEHLLLEFSKRLEYEGALLHALKEKQFVLYFQPQVSVADGSPIGVEALIRWEHPILGLIPPGDFIPIAESIGVINDIGLWVIEDACKQLASIHLLSGKLVRLAINVSAHQLASDHLEEQISRCLQKFNLSPSFIELEVTETAAIEIPDDAIARLQRLKDLGIRLAIDDFGTGFSSLSYLHKLPVHALKLDKSFVDGVGEINSKSFSICKNAINLARDLGLEVVAEGVETQEQALALKQIGSNFLQGYFYSKPMPAGLLLSYLQDQNKRPPTFD